MSVKKVKVMIAGSVNGRLDLLHARVDKINSSRVGPFDLVLCTGRFSPRSPPPADDTSEAAQAYKAQFGDFLSGAKKMPIATYFLANGPSDGSFLQDSPAGAQVAENLHFLGTSGVKVLGGLKVGFVCVPADAAIHQAFV